jgi:hypothetical protein
MFFNPLGESKMKVFIELVFLGIGIAMFAFSIEAAKAGMFGWSLAIFGVGFCFLGMMLLVAVEER